MGITDVFIPEGVRELCDLCFLDCTNLRIVAFAGKASQLARLGEYAFSGTVLNEITIPDSVRDIAFPIVSGCVR